VSDIKVWKHEEFCMRLSNIIQLLLLVVASSVLILLALCEVGMSYPEAWWLYLALGVMFGLALAQWRSLRKQVVRVSALLVVWAIICALYFVEWSSRKPFLHDLYSIRLGMTEGEARKIMARYMEGTGWPMFPGSKTNEGGTLRILGNSSEYSTRASDTGEMAIRDALVFRHSKEGAFNSDWGIVTLSNGKVVKVEFSPD
jgi:hypothetical protein